MDKTQTKKKNRFWGVWDRTTIEANIPEDVEWIDDAFYIKKTRFGLFTSILKEPIFGAHFITGATEEGVLECHTLASQVPARRCYA